MIIAGRTARGEGVAEQKPYSIEMALAMSENVACPCPRHDQIGIILIPPHHSRRRHDAAADDVVGDIEQAADKCLIAGDAVA